ncbi:MAG: hypothetical protein FWD87_00945 [Spirochaetaceae bacterium]|nr:hypothetical protein [Spirochaetaceae bacterium]
MLIIIAVILNFVAIYFIFHYFKWKLTSHNFLESYEKKKNEIGEEINLMLIEINKTTERNLQILEAKINQLNEVVARSEKVFGALKKEKEITENSENIYQKLERKSINNNIEKVGKVKERHKVLDRGQPEALDKGRYEVSDKGQSEVLDREEERDDVERRAKEVISSKPEPELFDNTVKPSDTVKVPKEDLHEKVLTMYKNGIDIELISRKLGITSGEVELIISISKIK